MRMVVLGDSVAWGQGLLPAHKFSTLVYQALSGRLPVCNDMPVLAHSGAIIGAGATNPKAAADGEVPDSYPTILQQCASFGDAPEDVDVVIVNGGINDVGPLTIVNPLTDRDDLSHVIERYCHGDMLTLLGDVSAKFSNPATKIVVPSYFPILSRDSDRGLVPHFLGLHGGQLNHLLTGIENIVFEKIFDQCQMFFEQSNACLACAVAEVNQQFGGSRVRYAQVPFTSANSALVPGTAWLWGIDVDLDAANPISAEDEVIGARCAACARDELDPIRRPICYRASAGHPNVVGAKQYAAAIQAALGL